MSLYSDEMCLLSGPSSTAHGTSSSGVRQRTSTPRSIYPLTKSQEGMWVEFQADRSSTKYNLTLEWDLLRNRSGSVPSIADILNVINKLTSRHAVLRSMFTLINNKAHLEEYVHSAVDPEIRIVHRQDSAISEKAMTKILRRPFDLENELPARWVILQDPEAYRVYIVGHHIVVDGQSMTIISREFLELLDNPEAKLPPATEFSTMHMAERAWAMSQTYLDNQKVLLDQVRTRNTTPWPQSLRGSQASGDSYRNIDSWCSFAKTDLDLWSQLFKTSWFRVATALVGLLVVDKTKPPFGRDEVMVVGFGSRPKEMNACVGQFANALPIKLPLWQALEDGSFKALVSALGKNLSAVKKAELFPAVDVARSSRALNMDYEPPRVAVTYSPKLAKSECRLFPVEGSWDLLFCFLEYEDDVKLGVIYNPEIFSAAALKAMKTQFDRLVSLSKSDSVKLTDMLDWLPTHPSLPVSLGTPQTNPLQHVHHWFDAQATSSPNSLALHSSEMGKSMTYGELFSSTEHKARVLRNQGVSPGDKVLIHLHRGFAIIEWILSVLKCGAAFVYLDTDFTEHQRIAVISNCKPSFIVDENSVQEMPRSIDTEAESAHDIESVKYSTTDDDLAYLIYTSGSTGEPKGVMVHHGALTAFVRASKDIFECGFGARVLQLASFSFDASVLEWSHALSTGACLCFAQYPKQLVGDYLADVIEENEISFMEITPTALETLPLTRDLPSLRQISMGGEAPSREIFAKWHSRVNLVNIYGPTETTIAVCINKIDKSAELPEVVSAGPPISQTSIYICAEGMDTVLRPGSSGEICVAGPQVTKGYCERPDITARSFVIHSTGVRMYRTGDRGVLLEDGSVVVLGRIDRELKIRGFRIAPEEIENAILDADVGAREASVQPSESGLEMLAYVAPDTVSTKSLLTALRRMLPSYKVPSKIHLASSLPKNVNGKIDHKAVKASRSELAKTAEDSEEVQSSEYSTDAEQDKLTRFDPANDETVIGEIWQDVLGLTSPPPAEVNFFDIGGHSLLVPKLHDKLKISFPSKAVRLVDLFHKSTIKSQALLFGDGEKVIRTVQRTKKMKKSRGRKTPMTPMTPMTSIGFSSPYTRPDTPASSIDHLSLDQPEIAIVGLAGRFPGAQNVDSFYDMLMSGGSGITESKTCTQRETLDGNLWVPRAGNLEDVESFDPGFWKLSEEEATEMDPQQRLFLEVAYEALVDAGVNTNNMQGGRVGIFVGAANPGYHLHTESVVTDSFFREHRGLVSPSISARTAYHLNISGPNVTIQTNCASSNVALSLAFDEMKLGRCDMAIVGGVSVQLYEGGYVTKKGQIFSARGECNPFDARADGTVPADAVTAVVLKRYSSAMEDGTPVYAKILGTGFGSDGALDKAGYQVPSPRGQAEVIKAAWKVANLSPQNFKYAEIHGSGTPIGDALELEGLSLAMKELGGNGKQFTVGSTKGNIGNTQHASGLVSLIKLCKSMQNGTIPATKGLETRNQMINPQLPITLASQKTKLSQHDILAVSAAGWGGVNTHVVLGFPDNRLRKQSTILVSDTRFNRRTFRAPRLNEPSASVSDTSTPSELTVSAFSQCASTVLGVQVDDNTDLKQLGLDSKSYTALVGTVSKYLSGSPVGVNGLLLPKCTPLALASLYESQLLDTKSQGSCVSTVVQEGKGVTIVCLPGSGGSCAGATTMLRALPQGVTVVALEHQGEDPTVSHLDAYEAAIEPYLTTSKLLLIGISMGGLSALSLLSRVQESSPETRLIILDSPALGQYIDTNDPILQRDLSRCSEIVYIGAVTGQLGTDAQVREQWTSLSPNMEMVEMDCGHFDIWGPSHGGQTATIIQAVLDKMSSSSP